VFVGNGSHVKPEQAAGPADVAQFGSALGRTNKQYSRFGTSPGIAAHTGAETREQGVGVMPGDGTASTILQQPESVPQLLSTEHVASQEVTTQSGYPGRAAPIMGVQSDKLPEGPHMGFLGQLPVRIGQACGKGVGVSQPPEVVLQEPPGNGVAPAQPSH
jgi:hypothetical protein